ncbi:MAG TPA: hypothetical protein VIL41_07790 [Coriobacteriia bacterium]
MTPRPARRRLVAGFVPDGVAVALAYLMAHGLMFLNKGIYWDDWVWYKQSWALLADVSRQLGSTWPAWTLAASYQSDAAIWITRVVVALCYLLASLWFLGILREMGVDRRTRLLMALCFAVFPVNGARIPIATAAYGVSLALFVGGFRLVVASTAGERPRAWMRVAAALALLLSLRTASFGVLLPVVLGYVVWVEGAAREPRRWLSIAMRHAELLVVPVVYVLLRVLVFVPSGAYGDYNAITLSSAMTGIASIPVAVWHSFVAPFAWGISELAGVGGLAVAVILFAILFFSRGRDDEAAMPRRTAAIWVAAGLALVVVALLPYLLVGKMPALSDFDSRHQLLVPFGAALAIGAALRFSFGPLARGRLAMLVAASLLLGGFIAADVSNNVSYLRERYKHIAMMEAMRAQPAFRSATTFTFLDRTRDLNANHRTSVRDYEYAGMMVETFGDQTRFGADADEFARSGMVGFRTRFTSFYKMGAYVEHPVQYEVEVLPGPLGIDRTSTVLRLLAIDVLHPAELRAATTGAVVLRLHAVGSSD